MKSDERLKVLAYLSVYEVTRHFGGPEEGGWYYDVYTHVASFPYEASQVYTWQWALDNNDQPIPDEGDWVPVGTPEIIDEPTRVRVEGARFHFIRLYGEPGTTHRFSVCPRGEDFIHVHELEAGELAERPVPRYE